MVVLKDHVNTYSPFKAAVEEDVKCPSAHILALIVFIAAIAIYTTITFIRFANQVPQEEVTLEDIATFKPMDIFLYFQCDKSDGCVGPWEVYWNYDIQRFPNCESVDPPSIRWLNPVNRTLKVCPTINSPISPNGKINWIDSSSEDGGQPGRAFIGLQTPDKNGQPAGEISWIEIQFGHSKFVTVGLTVRRDKGSDETKAELPRLEGVSYSGRSNILESSGGSADLHFTTSQFATVVTTGLALSVSDVLALIGGFAGFIFPIIATATVILEVLYIKITKRIGYVSRGTWAANTGLEAGDRITHVNGIHVADFEDPYAFVKAMKQRPLRLTVELLDPEAEKAWKKACKERGVDNEKVAARKARELMEQDRAENRRKRTDSIFNRLFGPAEVLPSYHTGVEDDNPSPLFRGYNWVSPYTGAKADPVAADRMIGAMRKKKKEPPSLGASQLRPRKVSPPPREPFVLWVHLAVAVGLPTQSAILDLATFWQPLPVDPFVEIFVIRCPATAGITCEMVVLGGGGAVHSARLHLCRLEKL
ncbi:hypothetical protein FOZ60_001871 [Perkinsus olseni]|uniref:PDZ domain-containing protein n=1 Tax=Perkinsus olseni TaxID=32597 RepID=A0A7J6PJ92_PEROL|nr:hypothetical protein FOZ60_001871 [Perkinsus olseni]